MRGIAVEGRLSALQVEGVQAAQVQTRPLQASKGGREGSPGNSGQLLDNS